MSHHQLEKRPATIRVVCASCGDPISGPPECRLVMGGECPRCFADLKARLREAQASLDRPR